MTDSDESEPLQEKLTDVTAILVLGVGLTALLLGFDWFWIAFVIGFAVVVPLVDILGDVALEAAGGAIERSDGSTDDEDDALAALKGRYARGEIGDAEFERRLERLIENETVERVEERVERETESERSQ